MDEFLKLMDEYESVFGDIFPTMCFQTDSDEQLMARMQKCLDAKVPAEKLFNLDYKNRLY